MNVLEGSHLILPEEDWELSPYTGFTRVHWEAVADGLIERAWRWATPCGAMLDLPGRTSHAGARSDGLEAFARTFLAAAFRVRGADGSDPHSWLERYGSGLAAGTCAVGRGGGSLETWPKSGDQEAGNQPMVEASSIALGLRLTRPWLWDHLNENVRDRVEVWLRDAIRPTPSPNNWYLFPFTVAAFLESVGRGDSMTHAVMRRALDLLDEWYQGDGWYSDGDGKAFDYYNGWALHFYPILHTHLADESALHAKLGDRLHEFLGGYSHFFSANGAPIHFGRSLTYRFAASAPVSLGAVTGHSPLSPGVARRLINGNLRYFLERGSINAHGLLSLGWHGSHEETLQPYSGPGSPYWASKAFIALLAPAGDPLWTEREASAPSDQQDCVTALPAPGLLLQSTYGDGIVRLHNHGSDHVRPHDGENAEQAEAHYYRQAYSTHTGPTSRRNVADNHFSVVVEGVASVRHRIYPLGAGGGNGWGWAASWHRPVFPRGRPMVPGLRVESVTVTRGRYELRVHRVVGAPLHTRVEQTGWAIAPEGPLFSELHGLYGWEGRDEVRAPQGTAFTHWAQMPRLTANAEGISHFVALAVVSGTAPPPPAVHAVSQVTVEGEKLEVRWSVDDASTQIAFHPLQVQHFETTAPLISPS
ncbi:DUF2264 domain-containing protein [Streptomyces sp. NPDC051658]|uniref:DUF2264 domain-containing protein n=1 Tax=Streptomyces sp. NPDC051658 TaxID=3365667 RepID=UPI0037B307BE